MDEEGRAEDESQRQVNVDHPFHIAQTPVTQQQWKSVMGSDIRDLAKSKTLDGDRISGIGDQHPVYFVNWADALRFCDKLTENENLADKGLAYTLPTEMQWEYACRAGTDGLWNVKGASLPDLGWFLRNSQSSTHEVGLKRPNGWGLFDMHGNVREWCADRKGECCVVRCGGWPHIDRKCRSAARREIDPESRWHALGFRPVLTIVGQRAEVALENRVPNDPEISSQMSLDIEGPKITIHNVFSIQDQPWEYRESDHTATRELPEKPLEFQDLPAPDELDSYTKELGDKRIILITSADDSVLLPIGYHIVESEAFRDYEPRLAGDEMLHNVKFVDFLCNKSVIFGSERDRSEPAIVLMTINDGGFLGQVFANTSIIASQRAWLAARQIALVCLVSEDAIALSGRKPPYSAATYHNLACWHIGSLSNYSAKTPGFEHSVDLKQLFNSDRQVEKSAAFVAAFFKRLSLKEFDYLMEILLSNQAEKIQKVTKVASNQAKVEEVQVPALERWHNERDAICENLGISVYNQSFDQTIGFTHETLSARLREQFYSQPKLLVALYRRLDHSRLLFTAELSPRLQRRMLLLAADMARVQPGEFGEEWLKNIVLDFLQEVAFNASFSVDSEDIFEILRAGAVSNSVRLRFFQRLGALCRGLYRNAASHQSVEKFLIYLVEEGEFETVHSLCNQLRGTHDFEYYPWIRRLLRTDVPVQVAASVLRHLAELASVSAEECRGILTHMWQWLLSADDGPKATNGQKYLTPFIAVLIQTSSKSFLSNSAPDEVPFVLIEAHGVVALTDDSVQRALNLLDSVGGSNVPTELKEALVLIVWWLSHPRFKSDLEALGAFAEISLADSLESWYRAARLVDREAAQLVPSAVLRGLGRAEKAIVIEQWNRTKEQLSETKQGEVKSDDRYEVIDVLLGLASAGNTNFENRDHKRKETRAGNPTFDEAHDSSPGEGGSLTYSKPRPIIWSSRRPKDPSSQALVQVGSNGAIREVSAPSWNPLCRHYTVQCIFNSPIVLRGATCSVHSPGDSPNAIEFVPELQIFGVDSATTVVSWGQMIIPDQFAYLENAFNDILREFIRSQIDPVHAFYNEEQCFSLSHTIRERLGVDARVFLLLDITAEELLEGLRARGPIRIKMAFNPERLSKELVIAFTYRIVGIDLANWKEFKRQASAGLTIDAVAGGIARYMKSILEPLFIDIDPNVLLTTNVEFWRVFGSIVDEVFAQRLGKAFGVRVEAGNFMRRISESERRMMDSERGEYELGVQRARKLNVALEANNFDSANSEVRAAEEHLKSLQQRSFATEEGIAGPSMDQNQLLRDGLVHIAKVFGLSSESFALRLESKLKAGGLSRGAEPTIQVIQEFGCKNISHKINANTGEQDYSFVFDGRPYIIRMGGEGNFEVRMVVEAGVVRTDLDLTSGVDEIESIKRILSQL